MINIGAATFERRESIYKLLPMKSVEHQFIKYIVNPKQLNEVKELYYKLTDTKIVFTNEDIAKNVYATCAMEGAVSSVADTINLLSRNRNPINHSERMIYNYLELINNPPGSYAFTDIIKIREIWDILSKDAIDESDNGYPFRDGYVVVANPFTGQVYHRGLDSSYIEEYLEILYKYLKNSNEDPLIDAIIFHFCFEHYHPFCDCNGRTGRFLMIEYLSTKDYEKFQALPINTVLYRDKSNYDSSLRVNYTNPDISQHIQYMLNAFKVTLYMTLYVNIDKNLGEFLRGLTSKYIDQHIVSSNILNELDDNGLLSDDSDDFCIMINEDLMKAINIYNQGLNL